MKSRKERKKAKKKKGRGFQSNYLKQEISKQKSIVYEEENENRKEIKEKRAKEK